MNYKYHKKMNELHLKKIFAAFFGNELFVNIIPDFESQEQFLKIYRYNLDEYSTLITAFQNQYNESYETLIDKLIKYFARYKYLLNRQTLADAFCAMICTRSVANELDFKFKMDIFKKLVIECVKLYTTLALSAAPTFCEFYNSKELTKLKQDLLITLESSLDQTISKFSLEISASKKGIDLSILQTLTSETTLVRELRNQNEDLRYKIAKLEEELNAIKIKNIKHELPASESDSDSSYDSDSEKKK